MKVVDDFSDVRAPGCTLGTLSTSGALRLGVDRERCISVDNGALRFAPLLRDGWNRQGISYGPVEARAGFAFAVGLLNGHNASQAGHLEQPVVARLRTWLGAGGTHRVRERVVRFARYGQHGATLRQLRRWLARAPRIYRERSLDENLAIGLYRSASPGAPQDADLGFVMHAAGADNGDLWVRVMGRNLPVLTSVQNVPLLMVMVGRARSTTYYVASSEAARGLPRAPFMRPVAVTPHLAPRRAFPGIHQSVLGQAGFRVDTRVYGVRIDAWDGERSMGLLLEDGLTEPKDASDTGASWQHVSGSFARKARGMCGNEAQSLMWRELPESAGLVHVVLDESGASAPALVFGEHDVESAFAVQVARGRAKLMQRFEGNWRLVAADICEQFHLGEAHSLLLVRDVDGVSAYLDGKRLFERPLPILAVRCVGVYDEHGSGGYLRALEVHPVAVPIPPDLNVPLPLVNPGDGEVLDERFSGIPGELEGRAVTHDAVWRKDLGAARIVLGAPQRGATVTDARHLTSRGRTVYTLPWEHPEHADLAVLVKPPGQRRGDGEEGRAGVVFWQDPDNYVIVGTWLHDHYGGASVSSFYCLRGFEDVYDAVWTNVGGRIRWGVPYELRVAFDGERFTASVNGEAVLHRALSDVRVDFERLFVRRVGIVANWEWGNDTGSEFRRFVARKRRALSLKGRALFRGVP